MPRIAPHLKLETSPVAHQDAVVAGEHWRISVLHEGLLRIEWSPTGQFENRASRFALHRDLPVPKYQSIDGSSFEIITERLHLHYDRKPFTPAGLTVQARGGSSDWHNRWRYSVPLPTLGGTAETLDLADGRIPLEDAVVSRDGIAMLDDSNSFLFEDDGWIAPRPEGYIDLYIFVFERDYLEALRIFHAVSGPTPSIPRYAYGNWWSRYHDYTSDSYLALMDRFKQERLPFSVGILDMGWHPVDEVAKEHGTAWTGYSWEKKFFPDPPAFLAEMKKRHMRVAVNDHPADGVKSFEDNYAQVAKAVGVDPKSKLPIAFDIANPDYMQAYLEHLQQPIGCDFIWLDYQQGSYSKIANVEPLFLLNHFTYLDSTRDGREPLILSRYGGPGSHRYPVGFSGDACVTWASLHFQPEFTACAANIGFGSHWSHDIGGHMFGTQDDELLARWFQFGAFSPFNRLHSSNNPFMVKEPWLYPLETRAAMTEALRFRHRLVPYLYSMSHRTKQSHVPLVCPMYYYSPDDDRAYSVPNQYYFGSELLVVPITSKRDPTTLCGAAKAFLPPGSSYVDIFTGLVYRGDREVELHRKIQDIPVLLKAGGILPLDATSDLDATVEPDHIEILLAPGQDGNFQLIEDAGETSIKWEQKLATLKVSGPIERSWTVTLVGVNTTQQVQATIRGGGPVEPTQTRSSFSFDVGRDSSFTLQFDQPPTLGTNDVQDRLEEFIISCQHSHPSKARIWSILTNKSSDPASKIAGLIAESLPPSMLSTLVELLSCVQ